MHAEVVWDVCTGVRNHLLSAKLRRGSGLGPRRCTSYRPQSDPDATPECGHLDFLWQPRVHRRCRARRRSSDLVPVQQLLLLLC
jgi:hypothetical protein